MGIPRGQVISAVSNLGTAYNLVNINLAHVIMENQYCGGDNCKHMVTAAGTACLFGAITGQLTFGYVGDCLGRNRAMQLTQVLSIVGAVASAFAVPLNPSDGQTVFGFVIITRLVLGVGVGGVYPLAATMTAECSSASSRGRAVAMVFSMQGVGTLLVPLLGLAIVAAVGTPETRTEHGEALLGLSWRLLLGFGALPGLLLVPFNCQPAAAQATPSGAPPPSPGSVSTARNLSEALRSRHNWPKLLGCAGGWFLFDITFYGNTIFQPTVLKVIFPGDPSTGTTLDGNTLQTNLCMQLAVVALIGLPGYYVAIYFMDKLGRKTIQIQGFLMMAVLYAVLALCLHSLEHLPILLLVIYGLTYFFSNFGPNSTTFILPSETFPPDVRSSMNGFCAASGKLGATLGSAAFKPILNFAGTAAAFWMCSVCALLGAVLTVFFIEDLRSRDMGMGLGLAEAREMRLPSLQDAPSDKPEEAGAARS